VLLDIRVLWFKSILAPILRGISQLSSVGLCPSKGERGTGTHTVPASEVCPRGSTLGTIAPKAAGEAVADDRLCSVHSPYANHEGNRATDEALNEDGAPRENRQLREPPHSRPHTAHEVVAQIGALWQRIWHRIASGIPPFPALPQLSGDALEVGSEDG
jgi:hypothetical protein